MAARRGKRRRRSGARLGVLVLSVGVAAAAVWGLWRISREHGRQANERAAAPAEEIQPAERARLDAVLERLGKDDADGKAVPR